MGEVVEKKKWEREWVVEWLVYVELRRMFVMFMEGSVGLT